MTESIFDTLELHGSEINRCIAILLDVYPQGLEICELADQYLEQSMVRVPYLDRSSFFLAVGWCWATYREFGQISFEPCIIQLTKFRTTTSGV